MLFRRLLAVAAVAATAAIVVSLLNAEARPLASQPFPDAQEYTDSARHLSKGDGFVTTAHGDREQPPRYPPGYPLALAPFGFAGEYPYNVQRGAKALVILYVLAAVGAAWVLGGPLAALIAAAFVGSSPFAHESAELVLSDAATAAVTLLALAVLARATRAGARLSGLLIGITGTMRLVAASAVAALLAATPRRLWKQALAFALAPLMALALLQWITFGSPFETGYSYWDVDDRFSLSFATNQDPPGDGPFVIEERLKGDLFEWACPCGRTGPQGHLPNAAFYPALLAGLFWVYTPPLATLPGLIGAWRRRREPVGRFTIALLAISLTVLILYEFQAARMIASAASVLLVVSAVTLAGWLESATTRIRASREPGPTAPA
jgi:4-amino-4-deoxy-L-arabinose transferase-like glycosyltransferase